MSDRFPFTPVEQDVVREFGLLGFCYAGESERTLTFRYLKSGWTFQLDRAHSALCLLVGFVDPSRLARLPGVESVSPAPRAFCSNVRATAGAHSNSSLPEPQQVILSSPDVIPSLVEALS